MENIAFFIAVRYAESISGLLTSMAFCGSLGMNIWKSFCQSLALGHTFKMSGCIWNYDLTYQKKTEFCADELWNTVYVQIAGAIKLL